MSVVSRIVFASLPESQRPSTWPAGDVRVARDPGGVYLLAVPEAVLAGEALAAFLGCLAPFGCPPPPSLIRAYSLPDQPYPSILLREHEGAPDGTGEAYGRFLTDGRRRWLTALDETGPGLSPVVAWQAGPPRQFVRPDEIGIPCAGMPDDYLGRGLLMLADPDLSSAWPTMMSLGGVTKARKITGREFPVWVDLPAHQPALLASPMLALVERLLG